MKKLVLLLLLSLTATAYPQLLLRAAARAGFDPARLAVLHSHAQQSVEKGEHAGIILLLVRDGKIGDFQSYGYRDLEKKLPMEKDTICRLYSMSKIVTSVGILVLLEDGALNLDDSVATYLPEFKEMKVLTGGTADEPQLAALKRPITIKHLLTHTSGLLYDFGGKEEIDKIYQRAELWQAPDLTNFISRVTKLPLKHQPGDAYNYGVNTDVLGAVIERVSGKPLGTFLSERIFSPLRMVDTGFDVPEEKLSRVAKTYKHGPEGTLIEAAPIVETWPEAGRGLEAGGAGLFGTARDYARFAQMLLNGGTLDGNRVLGRKTVELMTANHLVSLPDNQAATRQKGFGLGVEVTTELGRLSTPSSPGQFGWYGAATTYCQVDPKERLVAVALLQHFPYNEHNFFAKFTTGYYQALK